MNRIAVIAVASVLACGGAAGAALATQASEPSEAQESDQALVAQARITMEAATAIALKARPGIVQDKELEKEAGGSGLRYTFEIKSPDKTYEVGVDAVTGAVLENGLETADND